MTVWDVFWLLFVFVPLCILWVITLVDMIGRRDLVGWQKAIWTLAIIFFPWIGVFAYLIARPRSAPFPSTAASASTATGATPAAAPYTPQASPSSAASSTPVPSPVSSDARETMA